MQIKDLPCGTLVKDIDTTWGSTPIVWEVVDKNHKDTNSIKEGVNVYDYPENSVTLYSKETILYAPFDAPEPNAPDDCQIWRKSGCVNWSCSNVRYWLNSAAENWYSVPSKHTYDAPPDGNNGTSFPYEKIPGFLSTFSTNFTASLLRTPCPTRELKDTESNYGEGTDRRYTSKCYVFLPSAREFGVGAETEEGTEISYIGPAHMERHVRPFSQHCLDLYQQYCPNQVDQMIPNTIVTRSYSFPEINFISTGSLIMGTRMPHFDSCIVPLINVKDDLNVEEDTDGTYKILWTDNKLDFSNLVLNAIDSLTKKVLNGNTFEDNAKPDWTSITTMIVNETYSLTKDNSSFTFSKGDTLSEGTYVLTVTITDPSDATNKRDFVSNFTVEKKQLALPEKINFKDKITSKDLINQFINQATPTWDVVDGTTESIVLTKDGTAVSDFSKETNLTDLGNYSLTVTLTDNNVSTNTKDYTTTFSIISSLPEKLNFKDKITTNTLDGNTFDTQAQPTWDDYTTTLNEKVSLTKNGSFYDFDKEDLLTEEGNYTLTVTLTDKTLSSVTKDYTCSFVVDIPDKTFPTSLNFKESETNSALENGKFVNQATPTWDKVDGVTETIALTKDGAAVSNFSKNQKLIYIGEYSLSVTLTDKNESTNTKTYTCPFSIILEKQNLPADINAIDKLTKRDLSGEFKFKVQPTWDDYTDKFNENVTLTKDGTNIDNYKKEDTLTDAGQYILSIELVDKNYPDNTKLFNETFSVIIPDKQDLSKIELNIIDKKTNRDLSGNFYSSVIPTWNDIDHSKITETVKLLKDDTEDVSFAKENEIKPIGKYTLTITLTDCNYPDNTKDFVKNFVIKDAATDLSQYIISAFDDFSGNVLAGSYKDAVKPVWRTDPSINETKIDLSYKMTKDSSDFTFSSGDIIPSANLGTYTLTITLTDKSDSGNKISKNFTFTIENESTPSTINDLTVDFIEEISGVDLTGEFYKEIKPKWTVNNNEKGYYIESYELKKDGEKLSYLKGNKLSDKGNYVLTVTMRDSKDLKNYVDFVCTFRIQINSTKVTDIKFRDKLTKNAFPYVFDDTVCPEWDLPTLTNFDEKGEIFYNAQFLKDYKTDGSDFFNLSVSDDGYYEVKVTRTDKSDTSNVSTYSGEFAIVKEILFTDFISKSELDGKTFKEVRPTWNVDYSNNINFNVNYKLYKDGTFINFKKEDLVNDPGNYELKYSISSKYNTNLIKSYSVKFKIEPQNVEINPHFFEFLTGTEILDGEIPSFKGKAVVTWKDIKGAIFTVNVKHCTVKNNWTTFDETYNNILKENKELKTEGSYVIEYSIQDDNVPTNNVSGILKFEITPEQKDLSKISYTIIDLISNKLVSDGSIFFDKVQPDIDDSIYSLSKEGISFRYELYYDSKLIQNYTEGKDVLTTVGGYYFKLYFTDDTYPDNKRTDTINFTLQPTQTDLSKFDPTFINKLTNDSIISEGQTFLLPTNKVQIDIKTLPTDLNLTSYQLYKDGSFYTYNKDTDTLDKEGKYNFSVKLTSKKGVINEYDRNFEIKESSINIIDFKIIIENLLDGDEITENKVYEELPVKPDWNVPNKTDITYTLLKDGKPCYLDKANTVLTDLGEYELSLHVFEIGNEANCKDIKRTFFIKKKMLDLNKDLLKLVDDLSLKEITEGEVFDDSVKPDFEYMDQLVTGYNIFSSLYKDGIEIKDFDMGNSIYSQPGNYTFTVTLSDPNYPNNKISKTVNFKILADPIDLKDREILPVDKLTNKIITQGEIIEGENGNNPEIQPTWSEYSDLNYTYTLTYQGSPLNNYRKENILRDIGEYRLYIRATDPNYINNYIEKEVVFYLKEDPNKGKPIPVSADDAYLNGLPYTMGTPITDSGAYDLMVVRKNPNNFKYSYSETEFTVVDDDITEKPIIITTPTTRKTNKVKVKILYPDFTEEHEYRINANGVWNSYIDEFEVTENCTVYARDKDPITNYYGESLKVISNIDNLPPDPPDLLGFIDGRDVYYTVSPTVKPVYGCSYSAVLNGEDYELGSPIVNNDESITYNTLVVTAKKDINGLTSSTTIYFALDSIPPDPPTIIGAIPNTVQNDATPDVQVLAQPINLQLFANTIQEQLNLNPSKGLYESKNISRTDSVNDYEGFLNAHYFKLGSKIDCSGSYRMSVTAIKKSNGLRATSTISFIIFNPIPESLGNNRLYIIPLREENSYKAYDGELLVDYKTGHLTIFDDGMLLSKTKELEERIKLLSRKINKMEIDMTSNESKILQLISEKNMLENLLNDLERKTIEIESDVNYMDDVDSYNFKDTSDLIPLRKEASEISEETNRIEKNLEIDKSAILNKPAFLKKQIKGLINNASYIEETIWTKNNKDYL